MSKDGMAAQGPLDRGVMPAAWVRYSTGALPHFVPVIAGSATFHCSATEALEYEPLYSMPSDATFEVCDADGIVQAETRGPREQALRDAGHYALMYGQDGPVQVFEVLRVPVRHNAVANSAALAPSDAAKRSESLAPG